MFFKKIIIVCGNCIYTKDAIARDEIFNMLEFPFKSVENVKVLKCV